jgi:hypothetical protein
LSLKLGNKEKEKKNQNSPVAWILIAATLIVGLFVGFHSIVGCG